MEYPDHGTLLIPTSISMIPSITSTKFSLTIPKIKTATPNNIIPTFYTPSYYISYHFKWILLVKKYNL